MDVKSKLRRRHSQQFKAEVMQACAQPGASVAAVARQFELNDNLVHQWRRGRGVAGAAAAPIEAVPSAALSFVEVALPASTRSAAAEVPQPPAEPVRIEIRRGGAVVVVTWPAAALAQCAGWLHEWLRCYASTRCGCARSRWTCAPEPIGCWRTS